MTYLYFTLGVGNVELEKGLISRNDAAHYLGVSIRTFYKYPATNLLASYKLPGGGLRKSRKKDLETFISELNL